MLIQTEHMYILYIQFSLYDTYMYKFARLLLDDHSCILPWGRLISSAVSTPWLSVVLCGGLRPSGLFPSHVSMSFGVPCSACVLAGMLGRLHGCSFSVDSRTQNLTADVLFICSSIFLPFPQ